MINFIIRNTPDTFTSIAVIMAYKKQVNYTVKITYYYGSSYCKFTKKSLIKLFFTNLHCDFTIKN